VKPKTILMTVAFTLASFVVPLSAADEQKSQEGTDVVAVAKQLMERAGYCALVTIGPEGSAEARIMDAFSPEADMTVWLGTNAASRKVEQIRKNPQVTLFYWDKAGYGYVTLIGEATLVDHPAEKAKHWKEEWSDFYTDAFRGADYLLIRVHPLRLEIVSMADGLLNDPATGRPVQHQFP